MPEVRMPTVRKKETTVRMRQKCEGQVCEGQECECDFSAIGQNRNLLVDLVTLCEAIVTSVIHVVYLGTSTVPLLRFSSGESWRGSFCCIGAGIHQWIDIRPYGTYYCSIPMTIFYDKITSWRPPSHHAWSKKTFYSQDWWAGIPALNLEPSQLESITHQHSNLSIYQWDSKSTLSKSSTALSSLSKWTVQDRYGIDRCQKTLKQNLRSRVMHMC